MENNEPIKKDVNLLPEEMRKAEEKEIKEARKSPRVVEIEMTDPKRGFTFSPDKTEKGPGFWSKIFNPPAKISQSLKAGVKGFEPIEGEDESLAEEVAAAKKIKKPSWWRGLFVSSEDKERRKLERLALAKVREEARRRQKEALTSAKLAARQQSQQRKQAILDQKSQKIKEEREHQEKMRWLAKQKKKQVVSVQSVPVVDRSVRPVKPIIPPPPIPPMTKAPLPLVKEKQKVQLTAGQLTKRPGQPGLEVNLIPQELLAAKELKFFGQIAVLAASAVLPLLVVGLLYLIIGSYQSKVVNEIKALDTQSEVLKKQIAGYEPDKAKADNYQQQLAAVEALLIDHFYWTQFFELLAKNTTPDVYYSSFTADSARGSVTMSATAKSYQALAKQLVAFAQAKDFIASADFSGVTATLDEKGRIKSVGFSLNLQLAPGVFFKDSQSNE